MKRFIVSGIMVAAGLVFGLHALAADAPAPAAKEKAAKKIALIDQAKCVKCGTCFKICPVKAISKIEKDKKVMYVVDPKKCVGCGTCLKKCPTKAIAWSPAAGDSASTATNKPVPSNGGK